MFMSSSCLTHAADRVSRRGLAGWKGAAIVALSTGLFAGSAQAADIHVEINQMRALHLGKPAATVIVGNPSIADVSVQGADLLYVLGKTYGKTNLIALDSSGKQIAHLDIDVVAQSSSAVTLTLGSGQLTYNCTPRCERVVNPSDSKDDFDTAAKQAAATAALGLGAAVSGTGGGESGTPQ